MESKKVFLTLLMLVAMTLSALAFDYDSALRLYRRGMYAEASEAFAELERESPDVFNSGYGVLCRIMMGTPGAGEAIASYTAKYGRTVLSDEMDFRYGLSLFDEGHYQSSKIYLSRADSRKLSPQEQEEKLFKTSYCDFSLGNHGAARAGFEKVASRQGSDFAGPSRYALGYIAYCDNDFKAAYEWFTKSSKDARFELTSKTYMLECRFMLKDYAYVTANGDALFAVASQERKGHLARIISESYFILGDTDNAKRYYDFAPVEKEQESRSGLFYAGSLQYSLGNYSEALEYFSQMGDRSDSLGQIAAYQMGWSYIQTKDKVSAMAAFAEAATVDFDKVIREDASFNHAKLSFDLNHDPAAFSRYLADYPDNGKKDGIYNYIALACLMNRDYTGAVAAYDKIEVLDGRMKANYAKANYLRAVQLIGNSSYSDAATHLKVAAYYLPRTDNLGKLSRYWLAESYFRVDNFNGAAEIYTDLYNNSALDTRQEGKLLPYNIAYCHFRMQDYDKAAIWFDKYLASGDSSARTDAAIRRGDCDFMKKNYKGAVKKYAAAASPDNPDNIYPYYRLGVAMGLNGDRQGKINSLQPVLDASPSAPYYSEAMFELGRAYVDAGRTDSALECFSRMEKNSPDSVYVARALIETAMIKRNASDADGALECYAKVARDYKNTGYVEDALLAAEAIFQQKNEPERFIDFTREVGKPVAKTPEEVEAVYFNSAEQTYMTENYAKALTAIMKYVDAYPSGSRLAKARYYAGDCLDKLGEKEKALEQFRMVSEMKSDPSCAEDALLRVAELSYRIERYGDALAAFSSLSASASSAERKLLGDSGMMRSAYRSHNFDVTLSSAQTVLGTPGIPESVMREAEYFKAKSLMISGKRDEALVIFRKLSGMPDTEEGAEASYIIIQDTYDRGDFNAVPALVYEFAENAPGQSYWLARSFVTLGDSFAENGNFKQAEATFKSVLSGYRPTSGTSDEVTDAINMRLEKLKEIE